MPRIFVVSDCWFNRLLSDNQDMNVTDCNEQNIINWNNVVNKEDIVYVLGGFGISDLYHIVVRLHGEIHFLDNYFNDDEKNFINVMRNSINNSSDIELKNRIIFEDKQIITLNDNDVVLSYFPLEDWYGKETGTYCFHGMNSIVDMENHSVSCALEKWDFQPVEIESIKKRIEKFNEFV